VLAFAAIAEPDAAFVNAGPTDLTRPYATVDVYEDFSNVGDHTVTALRSSGMSPTYLGFKLRRPTGAAGFIGFQFEHTFDPLHLRLDHGAVGNRILTLDLNSSWGYFRVGRQFTPQALLMGAEVDAFQAGFWGSPYAVWDGGVPLMLRARALSWQSVPVDGISVHAMLARDAVAGPSKSKQQNGNFLKIEWNGGDGEFLGAVIVDERSGDGTNWRKLAGVGAGWPLGGIDWTAGVQIDRRPYDRTYTEWALGAVKHVGIHDIRVSVAGSAAANSPQGGRVYGVAYVYRFTDIVNLYTSVARLQNSRNSQLGLGVPVAPGQPANDLMVGVRMRF